MLLVGAMSDNGAYVNLGIPTEGVQAIATNALQSATQSTRARADSKMNFMRRRIKQLFEHNLASLEIKRSVMERTHSNLLR